jgi:hypothetical protein
MNVAAQGTYTADALVPSKFALSGELWHWLELCGKLGSELQLPIGTQRRTGQTIHVQFSIQCQDVLMHTCHERMHVWLMTHEHDKEICMPYRRLILWTVLNRVLPSSAFASPNQTKRITNLLLLIDITSSSHPGASTCLQTLKCSGFLWTPVWHCSACQTAFLKR